MPQAQLDGWETAFRFSDDIAAETVSEPSYDDPYSTDSQRSTNRRTRRRAQRPLMTSALRPSHALRALTFEQEDNYAARSMNSRSQAKQARPRPDSEMDEAFLNALADKLSDRLMHYLRDPDVMRDLLNQERQYKAQSKASMAYPPLKVPLSSTKKQKTVPQRFRPTAIADDAIMVDAETLLEDNILMARQIKHLQAQLNERQDVINWLNAEYQGFRHVLGSMYLKV